MFTVLEQNVLEVILLKRNFNIAIALHIVLFSEVIITPSATWGGSGLVGKKNIKYIFNRLQYSLLYSLRYNNAILCF